MRSHSRLAVRAAGALLIAMTLAAVSGGGCRTATQVTVEIATTGELGCAALKGIAIVVAASPQEAEDRLAGGSFSAEVTSGTCGPDGKLVGTLVVTPGESRAAVVVRARVDDAAPCERPDYKGCIVARRTFSFIDHASVVLPIGLEIACKDVPCDVLTSCRRGTCAPSNVECSEASGVCESPDQPAPGGDAGAPDGGSAGDAIADGGFADVALDAPADGSSGGDAAGFGNECPTMTGPVDCKTSGGVCCYQGAYFCQSPACTMGYYEFHCVGRRYCAAGAFCCGLPNSPATAKGSACDTSGGQTCSQNGNHYICSSDDDCPNNRPKCSGVYYAVGMGTIKECTAN